MVVRQTRIGYHLDLSHPNQAELRHAGVTAIGIDHWEPGRVWGRRSDCSGMHRYLVLSGTVHLDALSQPVVAGCLVSLPPGVSRRRVAGDQPVTAIFCDRRGDGLHKGNQPVVGVQSIRSGAAACCQVMLEQLVAESRQAETAEGAGHLCRALLAYLNPSRRLSIGSQHGRERLDCLWRTVRDYPGQPWTTLSLAAEVGCSPGHLHRLCAEHASASPMRMVTILRLEQAARLLQATHRSLEDIAHAVGFATASAFSDAFLKRYQQRPGRWRGERV